MTTARMAITGNVTLIIGPPFVSLRRILRCRRIRFHDLKDTYPPSCVRSTELQRDDVHTGAIIRTTFRSSQAPNGDQLWPEGRKSGGERLRLSSMQRANANPVSAQPSWTKRAQATKNCGVKS